MFNKLSKIKSFFLILILKLIGIKIDTSSYIKNFPYLKINGKAKNIFIGKNVQILGKIDLRNRENGKIIIRENVSIEGECRFVAAREGEIVIGENTIITRGAIINGGGNIYIGSNCILGPYNVINANDHKIGSKNFIRDKEFIYGDVKIGDNVWTGAFTSIKKDVEIKNNSIIGAHSFVTKDTEENSINYGVPTKFIKYRD